LQTIVKQHIEDVLAQSVVLEKPKDIALGHFSTPLAFSLAKSLKKSPIMIAQELACKFENSAIFQNVEAVKGFINFKLSNTFLETLLNESLQKQEAFAQGDNKNERILLEYVSANPTGPLHIGHARGAIFGDTLYKVGKYLGYDITSEYYINDAGAQMDLLGLSLYLAGRESILKLEVEYPEQYYRGEYLYDIAQKASKHFGEDVFHDATKMDELALFGKDEVLELIKQDLAHIGITFENFVSEKSLYQNWEATKEKLEKNGSLYEKDEKIWIRSTQHGDDVDRVVVRQNKIPTYLAGDIIYHDDKFARGYDSYINIWGADHHGYITRVKAAIEFLGYDSNKLEVLLSQMVSLLKGGEPYKMSKRAGNVIMLSDVAQEIGSDALRFIFLTKKSDTHLEFDLQTLTNQDSSNPIFYINYAHARIHQLCAKSDISSAHLSDIKLEAQHQDVYDLLYESLLLNSVLQEAFLKRDMQKITDYLYSLASRVHKFYNEHRIIGNENELVYLKVLSMTALSIRTGLKLLGIQAKDVM
jgi:arginyl-tRNA synthetase